MITAVRSVGLRVEDTDAAEAFYRDVVGLPDPSTLVRLRSDGVTAPAPRRAAGLFHTAFRFPARADLSDALRRVAARGARLTGASDHGVSEALYLDDPSGNGVELYWDRPREVWPDDMYTEPLDLQDLARAGHGSPRAPEGTDIGHVHLKVSDLPRAEQFWVGDLGFDLMHRYGDQAAFVATGGYHHHVGLNTWYSLGAAVEPPDGPGLDRVVFRTDGEARELNDPDGIAVELSPG